MPRETMAKITYIQHSGAEHVVDVQSGLSVMEGAVKNNVPGIDADCGGAAACATCHVYVDETWLARTGGRTAMEESMLDFAEAVEPNSRLSCQIKVSDVLDGLVVRLPENQH
jgi:2Fe-2S ferredoxin